MAKAKIIKITIFLGLVIFIFFVFFRLFQVIKPFNFSSSLLSPQSPAAQADIPFLSFAVIGDPESDEENLKKSLAKVKEEKLALAVLVGDLSQTGTPKELGKIKQILDKSDVDYYSIPGNHDLWYSREEGVDAYRQVFGQRYYAREIKDFRFIFLDNADEWRGFDEEQLAWFDHYLLEDKDFLAGKIENKYLVFTHIPFYHPESAKAMGEYEEKLKDQAYQLLQEFCQQPPLAVFSGHLHHTADYFYGCGNGKRIRMINAGSVHETRNWQLPRFLRIDLFKDGHLEKKEIELDN